MSGAPTGTIPVSSNPNAPIVLATPARRNTGTLAPGALLGGRYRVVEMVGKGGFGAVYKATDQRFQGRRVVAIKEMSDAHLSPSDRAQAIKDFRQEADLLVQLKHPNLPDVSDFFEEGGKAYLVMEFIEGKTLEKVQEDIGHPLDEKLVMKWAVQLCDVLSYLHVQPQPIIFRDLKPSNVMVIKNGQIKLIDFGIARIFKSTSAKDTTTLGSRGYAPLEQYGRGQSDPRSDIYALGATMYDLLTNSVPADAPMRRLNPLAFQKPSQLNPGISKDTEQIVLKAMAEEPKDRYQSAIEMLHAIMSSNVFSAPAAGQYTPSTFTNFAMMPATVQASPSAFSTQAATLPATAGQPYGNVPQSVSQIQAQANPVMTPMPLPSAYHSPGTGSPPSGQPRMSRRSLLIGGLVVTGAVVAGGVGASRFFFSKSTAANTVPVNLAYSTEKDAWLTAAAQAFNSKNVALANSNKIIQVTLGDSGSLDVGDKIFRGESQPVAWSPASELEWQRLDYQWNQKYGQNINATSTALYPTSLVYSPLVFAVWKDRASTLLKKYQMIDWDSIHSALLLPNGWGDLGQPEWRSINLGQTRTNTSNSGLLAVMLMVYAYTRKPRLTLELINNPNLWNYIGVFENAVNEFGLSSGTYFTQNVIADPPSAHAISMTYENLVLLYQGEAQQQGEEPLQIFFPGLNAISNHPFAILDTPWVTAEQQQAALQFRDFLLGPEQQLQALKYGFRPGNSNIQITDLRISNNPFKHLSQLAPNHTFDINKDLQANVPSGAVVDALISQWTTHYPNP